jgi:flagellar motility protein MotE (MotC chaperone)
MIRNICIICFVLLTALPAFAQEDIVSLVEKQRIELDLQEENIKKEMERLKTIKNEVEADIEKYSELLKQIEKSLEQAETTGGKRLRHIAQAYEAMPPEDAAARLAGLDNRTAVQILLKMSSKKAGLVIGMMEARKATVLTKDIAKMKK